MSNLQDVTRLEIIDHTKCDSCDGSGRAHIEGQTGDFECPVCHGMGMSGREIIFHNPSNRIEASLQDDGRTLKFFIEKRTV
jgi:DnaJ-class molecular chaperone